LLLVHIIPAATVISPLTSTVAAGYFTLRCKVNGSALKGEPAMFKILLPVAVCLGLSIAYVDSRPNWDDTGITALALVLSCGVLGVLGPERPWLWALAIGAWIPAYGIASSRNFGSLLAIVFAFVGAYAGMGARKAFERVKTAEHPQ
jgi:hypothetical protein